MRRPISDDAFASFVVIAYNEAANIERTIGTIGALDGLGDYEVVVVDDCSRDGTAELVGRLAERDPRLRLIPLGQNHGRGYARRTGIAAAQGELIATVDADITLPRDWFLRARAALRDHDAAGGTPVPDGDVQYVYRRFKLVPRVVPATTAVAGSNGLYRRAVFDAVGFDPGLREGEDSALNHAMQQEGLSSVTVPGLLVTHRENKPFATSLRWLFDVGRGATRQLLTYRQVRQPDLAAAAFVVAAALGVLAALKGHPAVGAAVPAGFVLAASAQHVRSRFETTWPNLPRVVPAVVVNGVFLIAYFAGRMAGLTVLWNRRPASRSTPERSSPRSAR